MMAKAFVLIVCHLMACLADLNVHNKMYTQLESKTPCVLRLNGTHSFGCTSSRSGNVGVVHVARNSTDLDWVLNSPPMDAYIVTLGIELFSLDNLKRMNNSDRVVGVLLAQTTHPEVTRYSPEDTCPNRYSGLAAAGSNKTTCDPALPWNPRSPYSEISMRKWNMPIFLTDNVTEVKVIEECFDRFNVPLITQSERSLCALQMSAHMFGAVDSATCIRRNKMLFNLNAVRYCDPLGDYNVWTPIVPFSRTPKTGRKYVVVAARLDSTSLFWGAVPGALSTAASLVALLATAGLLSELTPDAREDEYAHNVLFALFNGEAYDYIGSSRVVYDMRRGAFPFHEHPIAVADISLFVELSQLRLDPSVVYHTYSAADAVVVAFVERLRRAFATYGLTATASTSPPSLFPPASLQSFLAAGDANVSGLVLASYDRQYANRYHHSVYDDAANAGFVYANGSRPPDASLQSFVANFSTALAYALRDQMTADGRQPPTATADRVVSRHLVDELLRCYVDTPDCEFGRRLDFAVDPLQGVKPDYYVGVNLVPNQLTHLTQLALSRLTGRNVTANGTRPIAGRDECAAALAATAAGDRRRYSYAVWLRTEARCLESAVNVSEAVSPAFVELWADDAYDLAGSRYSSWTESGWAVVEARVFARPSARYERVAFAVGNAVLAASFAALYWIRRRARELFNCPQLMSAASASI